MHRVLFLLLLSGCVLARPAGAHDSFPEVDLLYPEFAHPREDAIAAIEKRDFRFISIDRYGKDVPGLKRYPGLIEIYGTRFVKQRFRLFATPSQNFSFSLRARAYAEEYNQTLLQYLLRQSRRK